jgi:hypothetical protein
MGIATMVAVQRAISIERIRQQPNGNLEYREHAFSSTMPPVCARAWRRSAPRGSWHRQQANSSTLRTVSLEVLTISLFTTLANASPQQLQSKKRDLALPLVASECDRRLSRQKTQLGNPQIDERLPNSRRVHSRQGGGFVGDHDANPEGAQSSKSIPFARNSSKTCLVRSPTADI